jgi:importin subunit alpha-1
MMVWALSNLCRGKPAPDLSLIAPAMHPLVGLLKKISTAYNGDWANEKWTNIAIDGVWALAHMSNGNSTRIQAVMGTGVLPILMRILRHPRVSTKLLIPTVQCLRNFTAGTDDQTQAIMDAGILKELLRLLKNPSTRREACWLASNIAAGTHSQIDALLKEGGVISTITEYARTGTWLIRKDCIWTLSNVFVTGMDHHTMALVQAESLRPLAEVLSLQNAEAVTLCVALDGIERVLEVSGRYPNLTFEVILDEYGGVEYLENLQEHPSEKVYKQVAKIISMYFSDDAVEEEENLAPETADDGTFEFGAPTPKQLFAGESSAQSSQPVFGFGVEQQVSNQR